MELEIKHANGSAAQVRDSWEEAVEALNDKYGDEIVINESWEESGVVDGVQMQRKLVWRNEVDADNDFGANAVAEIIRPVAVTA